MTQSLRRLFRPALLFTLVGALAAAGLAACPQQSGDSLIATAPTTLPQAQVSDEPPALVEGLADAEPGAQAGIVRRRTVRIRTELIVPGAKTAPLVGFAPFADVNVRLEFERFETTSSGVAWVGHAAGEPSASTTIVVVDGAVAGNVRKDSMQWRLRTTADGAHVVDELNLAAFPQD